MPYETSFVGIWEGVTENSAVCQALVDNLISRGLPADKLMLFVIDGAKALRKVIRQTFGKDAIVQRCETSFAVSATRWRT